MQVVKLCGSDMLHSTVHMMQILDLKVSLRLIVQN